MCFCGEFFFIILIWRKKQPKVIVSWWKFMVSMLYLSERARSGLHALKWWFWLGRRRTRGCAAKVHGYRIGGIARSRSGSNARRGCKNFGSWSINHFQTFKSHGNDPKGRPLGAVWIEAKRRWTPFYGMRTTASTAQKKGFFASNCDWRWKVGPLRQSKTSGNVWIPWPCFNIDVGAEYSWPEGYAVYLVGPAGCCVLWATETEWNDYGGCTDDNWCVWAEHCEKNGRNTPIDTTKLFCNMTMLGHMLHKWSKHT